MNTLKIILLTLLLTSLQAKSAKWQKLQGIDSYLGSDYHLKKDVSYMEIRWYATRKSRKITKTLQLYRKPLESYPQSLIAKFKSLKPRYSNSADIGGSGNAFFIDTNGKMFQMDMKKDIISLLGKIDRPAEVELILYLNHEEGRGYYKKLSKGYKIKSIAKLKQCTNRVRYSFISYSGKYIPDGNYKLQRVGCKERKDTKFIKSRRVSYESYEKIVLDDKGDLYLLGVAKKSKSSDDYESIYLLDKYSSRGRKIWSKRLELQSANGLLYKNGSIYILSNQKPKARFLPNGKRVGLKDKNIMKVENSRGDAKYSPEGLPNKEEALGFYLHDYAKDKRGNIYIVGSEVFYPSGTPDEIPNGECGNTEELLGALVARLSSRGKTIWARVVDRDE